MPTQPPAAGTPDLDRSNVHQSESTLTLQLHAEDVSVAKRVSRTLVRAATSTSFREQLVEADLDQTQVVVERVSIGRVVDAVPPVRVEGDVTILPVVVEELVLVRQLVLKEEVHLRTVRSVARHVETVTLREQDAIITRTPLD